MSRWRMDFNPVYAVRLEPEVKFKGARWSPEQAARFLAYTADDPLHLMFRLILFRGLRRAEAVGLRWAGADLDAGYLTVARPILQLGGVLVEGRPKSDVTGERRVWLDAGSVTMIRAHRRAQAKARLQAATAWQDNDLIFCQEDGTPWSPDYVFRRFQHLSRLAGLPVIRLHDARHTAASLLRDAGVDRSVR